jgi:predicted Zn-dependent peptidase
MRALIQTSSDTDVLCLMFFVHAGSLYDPPHIRGIAHMLEHMLFTTKKNKTESKLFAEITKAGAIFNAYTSFDSTVYFISGTSANWKALLEIFYTIVMDEPDFTEEEFNREKRVVLEERNMRSNELVWNIIGMFLENTDYDKDPAGTVQSIKNITMDDLKAYHAKYYKDSYMVACLPETIKKEASKVIRQRFGKTVDGCFERPKLKRNLMRISGSQDKILFVSAEQSNVLSNLHRIPKELAVENEEVVHRISLFFASVSYESKQVALVDFWTHVLGGLDGLMYANLRGKHGYTYGVQCNNTSLLDVGYYQIGFQTIHEDLAAVMDVFCNDLLKLKQEPSITKEAFQLAKKGFMAQQQMDLSEPYNKCSQLGYAAFYDGILFKTAEEYLNFIDNAVTYDAVLEMAKELFAFNNSKFIIESSVAQETKTKARITEMFMKVLSA